MQREVILIFGQTGSGKTTIARQILATCPRALIADADFGEFPAQQFPDFPSLLDHLERVGAFPSSPGQLSYTPFRVSFTPRLWEHPLVFETAQELGNVALFLEEADRFDDPRQFPEYDEVVTRGRHYGVSLVALSLHPFKIPTELRRQATRIIAFRQIMPGDIAYLADIVGPDAEQLAALPPFHYLEWTPAAGAAIRLPVSL